MKKLMPGKVTRDILKIIAQPGGWFAQYRTDPKDKESRHGVGGYRYAYLPVISLALVHEHDITANEHHTYAVAQVSPADGCITFADEEVGFMFLEYFPEIGVHPEIDCGPRLRKSEDPHNAYWFRRADWIADAHNLN